VSASSAASPLASASAPGSASASTSARAPTGGDVFIGEINAPKSFDPKPTLDSMRGELLSCYNAARAQSPALSGKLTLRIQVSDAGAVLAVQADPAGRAYDLGLVSCINDAMKASARFPRPGGTATISAPLVFRP
jgi:hypothetical protein